MALAVTAVALTLAALGLQAVGGPPDVAETLLPLVFVGIGYVVATRVPDNVLGWMFLAFAALFAFSQAADSLMFVARDEWRLIGLAQAGAVASSWPWFALVGAIGTFFLLLFPDGHLPGPRWRPVAWVAAVAIIVGCLLLAGLTLADLELAVNDPYGDADPVMTPLIEVVALVAGIALAAAAVASIASLFVRWRRAGGLARQQLKWFAFGALVQILGFFTAGVERWVGPHVVTFVSEASLLALPAAAALAILRFRLYDIDRILSRTVSYALLTAALLALYFAAVTALTSLTAPVTGDSPMAVAAATLLAASAFQPLRRRIQSGVDRRFNRSSYDAAHAVEAYRARLRDELDLETIGADLIAVAGSTVQPRTIDVWFASDGAS